MDLLIPFSYTIGIMTQRNQTFKILCWKGILFSAVAWVGACPAHQNLFSNWLKIFKSRTILPYCCIWLARLALWLAKFCFPIAISVTFSNDLRQLQIAGNCSQNSKAGMLFERPHI